ncbi:MAG: hypothetical protein H6R06_4223 [Proteobacteria bacterium]|jgi:hypothetical protein|nr:hypothetical protein [Pseudomonadota bacterium]
MQQRYLRPSDLGSTKDKPGRWPVTPNTLWRWVQEGILPPPIRLGPQVSAWPLEVIEAYEAEQAAARSLDGAKNPNRVKAGQAAAAAAAARRR